MSQEKPTFEEIDQSISSFDFAAYQQGKAKHLTAGNPLQEICPVYQAIRPVLVGVLSIPFIPASWKIGIQAFISIMDALCSGNPPKP